MKCKRCDGTGCENGWCLLHQCIGCRDACTACNGTGIEPNPVCTDDPSRTDGDLNRWHQNCV